MRRSVLVVDDDAFIRRLVMTTLRDVGEFDLHEAADGAQAVQMAELIRPAIIFLDVDMPRMDGIAACRAIRASAAAGGALIVMVTGSEPESIEPSAREAGADVFLTKPFSPLDLLRLVTASEG